MKRLIKNLSSGIRALLKTMLFCGCLIIPLTGYQSLADDRLAERQHTGRWSVEESKGWHEKQPWLVGCNFIPSTAINQLEMWQADTFDPETIDRELGWAAGIGFNAVRVYLHDLAYDQDPDGFLQRMDRFLRIADAHGIKTLFVIFDDCWLAEPKAGKQPEPWPGVHNSGWLESPGLPQLKRYPTDSDLRRRLEKYVKAVLIRFRQDKRVLMWDLYNEPGGWWYLRREKPGSFKRGLTDALCLPLLQDVYRWARSVNPSQPLTSCWNRGAYEVEAALKWADVVTFHCYGDVASLENLIRNLQQGAPNRPIICTEYLWRNGGSRFQTHLPVFRRYQIGAINWGLVAGKSNTIWGWESWNHPGTEEPKVWHHDILRKDGTSYDEDEVTFIRSITNQGWEAQHDSTAAAEAAEPYTAYLMAYFGPEERLFYSWSRDARNWTALNGGKPVFDPGVRLRDPFVQCVNGQFHLVHTKGWDHPTIFHWESADLINWKGGAIDVVPPDRKRAWAPEFFYEKKTGLFYVFWASIHNGHNTMHVVTTRDWTDITPDRAQVYYDIGIHDIDLTIVEFNGVYYGFHKPGDVDDRMGNRLSISRTLDPQANIFAEGGPGKIVFDGQSKPTEGPEVIQLIGQNKWYIYGDPFHSPMEAWETTDFVKFKRIVVKTVPGSKHCSMFPITETELRRLCETYPCPSPKNEEAEKDVRTLLPHGKQKPGS